MEKYNGWTNYATWRVHLEVFDGCNDLPNDPDFLKEYVEEVLEAEAEGMALSYALAFISDVNWHEIAEYMHDE